MKHELRIADAPIRTVKQPYFGAGFAIAEGACPLCKAEPFKVAGSEMRVEDDRRYVAKGFCLACKVTVGRLVATPSTIFGITEDRAVLEGRCRVY